jgi:hypothetical protein
MQVFLTDRQRALLRGLVIKEAKTLGYGEKYHSHRGQPGEPKDWPERLKVLNRVGEKLMPDIDVLGVDETGDVNGGDGNGD